MAFYKHTGIFSLPLVLVKMLDSSCTGHSNCSSFLHFRDTPTGTLLRCCLCESLAIRTSETGSHTWEVRLDQSHTSSSLSISLPPAWESSSRIAMWNLPYPQKGLWKRFPLLPCEFWRLSWETAVLSLLLGTCLACHAVIHLSVCPQHSMGQVVSRSSLCLCVLYWISDIGYSNIAIHLVYCIRSNHPFQNIKTTEPETEEQTEALSETQSISHLKQSPMFLWLFSKLKCNSK